MRPFPIEFDLSLLTGPRGRQFERREDAFQQLIGDALHELVGDGVHVAPTRAPDGGIDVWSSEGVFGLPGPTIVEAKDHDSTAARPWNNALAAWREVAEKLTRQAMGGWLPPFDPWGRACSYAYCISLRVSQSQRQDLEGRIHSWLASIPEDRRPPIEQVTVRDWEDLRKLLERLPRTSDSWLGLGEACLTTHAEYRSGLQGFRRYLLPEEIPYVEAPQPELRPRQLLERLRDLAGKRGVLVVGPGGVGKTRLAMEVAELASAEDVRVLHALPVDPGVDFEMLRRVVLGGANEVESWALVVFDYLDQMHRLDLGAIERRLMAEAADRGVRLMLLATARPSIEHQDRPARDALFEQHLFEVDPEHEDAVAAALLPRVAPAANKLLPPGRLRELCGHRPIVAMLAAREIERRASEAPGAEVAPSAVRSPDLIYWLQRRLAEGRVGVPEAVGLERVEPTPEVVAAAAVLGAAPDHPTALERIASSAGSAGGSPGDGRWILSVLGDLGWLEVEEGFLATPHDTVADEVLDQVLRRRPTRALRHDVLKQILDSSCVASRTVGRFAVSFSRLQAIPNAAENLQPAAAEWLIERAERLGRLLREAPADESGYALGAVVSSPIWTEAATTAWEHLVQPWLEVYSRLPEARHLFYRGLGSVSPTVLPGLVAQALQWLGLHRQLSESSFVLRALLRRDDIGTEEAAEAVESALSWLEQHGPKLEAQFVLDALLGRPELREKSFERALDLTLAWLREHGAKLEAGFVLRPLLGRPELREKSFERALDLTLAWLREHGAKLEAGFVLPPLLGRPELRERSFERALDLTLAWLREHGAKLEAEFVLQPLLGRPELRKKSLERALDLALAWLEEHGAKPEAGFVLHPLLGRPELRGESSKRVLGFAQTWIEAYGTKFEARYVLVPLLENEALKSAGAERIVGLALDWVDRHSDDEQTGFLLEACLKRGRKSRSPAMESIVARALDWLERRPWPGADFVAKRLLRDPQIAKESWTRAAVAAIEWLRRTPQAKDRDHIINSLLNCPGLIPDDKVGWFVADARRWLDAFDPDGRQAILRRRLGALEIRLNPARMASLHHAVEFSLAEELTSALETGEVRSLDPCLIDAAMRKATKLLETDQPGIAGYYLVPLTLAAAIRDDEVLSTEVLNLVRQMLNHQTLNRKHHGRIASAFDRLMAFWPDREAGERTLTELGLGSATTDQTPPAPGPPGDP